MEAWRVVKTSHTYTSRTCVGLAAVAVLAGGGQLDGEGLAGGVQQVLAGDGVSVHTALQAREAGRVCECVLMCW